MQLRFTMVGPGPGQAAVDVRVDAPRGARLSSVRAELNRLTGFEGPLYAGRSRLADEAVLGRPPLTTGAILAVGRPAPAPAPAAALLELRVVGGPDAGGVHKLAAGEHRLGRGSSAEIRVGDPDVSRSHALLSVRAGEVLVGDAGSTNGTRVGGRPVDGQPVPLAPGSLLQVGESTLCLVGPDEPPAAVRADGQGHLEINRPPRLVRPPPEVEVVVPAAPTAPDNPRFPVLAMVIPLVLGAVMVQVMQSWTFALFMLLSPVMLGANVLSDRVGGRRSYRRARADYQRADAEAQARVVAAVSQEAAERRSECPDAATLLLTAVAPRPRLWERHNGDADALILRVGTADLPARLLVGSPGETSVHPPVRAVPVTVGLREVGVLGLAGPRPQLAGLARHLVAQLATLHSPRQLDLVLLCAPQSNDGDTWRWMRWLPHLQPRSADEADLRVGLTADQIASRVTGLVALLDARVAVGPGRSWSGPITVMVIDGARSLRSVAGVARLLDEGPAVGIHAVCLAADALDLPAECGATALVTGAAATRLRISRTGHPPVAAVADLVSLSWAEQVARALAPLRDATPESGSTPLPAAVRLLDVMGGTAPAAAGIIAGWAAAAGSTTAVLGLAADGTFSVDLRRDGPHALVAGTTGAGKSELLQTLIASLALVNRPDELVFVLVDYKGGSAFADCARLPHTVGMVTDLDAHLTRRALASLDAELKRRERTLRAAGCKDVDDYAVAGRPQGPMPRLVIAIDEFASLAQELPDFVTGLVDIARRGRSLGVHLVLATQRPGGVVSAEIRANTNLRIALRVTDPAESQDVIEVKDAALISRSTPGRAFCRTGAADVAQFQCARVGGPVATPDPPPSLRVLHWNTMGDPCPVGPDAGDGGGATDLSCLVGEIRQAAEHLRLPAVRSPWLPPLPATTALADLGPAAPDSLLLGRLDLPGRQAQTAYRLELAGGGHLLVAGGPRSGRTTLLRTLAGAIADTAEITDVHVFAFDGAGGGLRPVADLPHAGAVVGRDEIDRGDRLLTRLTAEVARRQQVLARAGFASLAEQRAGADPDERLPWLVVLIDGWEGLVSSYERVDSGRPVDTLLGLLRQGAAVGLRAVVTGDRSTLTGRLPSLVPHRLILRMADPMDYALAGLAPRQIPESMPPGRGLIPGEPPIEAQVALLGGDPAGPAQVAELARLAALATTRAAGTPAIRRPLRVEALPDTLPYAAAAAMVVPGAGPLWALVGVGGDQLSTVGIDLGADGRSFVVAGPPRSGRSTALATMSRWYVERGIPVLVVAPPRSPVCDVAGVSEAFGPADAGALQAAISAIDGPLVLVVDDAEALLDSPVEPVLCAALQRATDRPWGMVLAGSTEALTRTYRGVTMEARKSRAGLLLCPSGPLDGDVLGVRLPRGLETRVGRGVLAVRGRLTPVQVAC